MAASLAKPCVIGVARRTWHPDDVGPDGAPEPLEMWAEMARAAAADAGAPGALSALESIQIVYCQSWQYDDAVGRLSTSLGADPKHRFYSGIGGTTPQMLVTEAAEAIATGEMDLGLVVGAEGLASIRRLKKDGRKPEWSFKPEERRPFPFDIPFHPAEVAHGIFEAFLTFALFDNARRAALGRGLDEHRAALGDVLAPMTEIAAADPKNAWFPVARSAPEITDPTADNRLVAYPYTKLMVSIMDVDMAAAVLVASDAKADELGVPRDQRVYLCSAAYAEDPYYVAERRELWRSPAMKAASGAALAAAGIGIDDVAHLDLYSCFASSVDFGTEALGLAPGDKRSVTMTGGLPYHGGPGSNYMTHSITTMVEQLRADPGSFGLVSGVGMHMTKHCYGLYSAAPRPYAPTDPAATKATVAADLEVAPLLETHEGQATVATYSVLHGRNGSPEWGAIVADVEGGARCYGRLEDRDALADAEEEELIGRTISLSPNDARVNIVSV